MNLAPVCILQKQDKLIYWRLKEYYEQTMRSLMKPALYQDFFHMLIFYRNASSSIIMKLSKLFKFQSDPSFNHVLIGFTIDVWKSTFYFLLFTNYSTFVQS